MVGIVLAMLRSVSVECEHSLPGLSQVVGGIPYKEVMSTGWDMVKNCVSPRPH